MADTRSPLARALDDFEAANPAACDPTTLGAPADQRQYLRNRLEAAFIAGANWGMTQTAGGEGEKP